MWAWVLFDLCLAAVSGLCLTLKDCLTPVRGYMFEWLGYLLSRVQEAEEALYAATGQRGSWGALHFDLNGTHLLVRWDPAPDEGMSWEQACWALKAHCAALGIDAMVGLGDAETQTLVVYVPRKRTQQVLTLKQFGNYPVDVRYSGPVRPAKER